MDFPDFETFFHPEAFDDLPHALVDERGSLLPPFAPSVEQIEARLHEEDKRWHAFQLRQERIVELSKKLTAIYEVRRVRRRLDTSPGEPYCRELAVLLARDTDKVFDLTRSLKSMLLERPRPNKYFSEYLRDKPRLHEILWDDNCKAITQRAIMIDSPGVLVMDTEDLKTNLQRRESNEPYVILPNYVIPPKLSTAVIVALIGVDMSYVGELGLGDNDPPRTFVMEYSAEQGRYRPLFLTNALHVRAISRIRCHVRCGYPKRLNDYARWESGSYKRYDATMSRPLDGVTFPVVLPNALEGKGTNKRKLRKDVKPPPPPAKQRDRRVPSVAFVYPRV